MKQLIKSLALALLANQQSTVTIASTDEIVLNESAVTARQTSGGEEPEWWPFLVDNFDKIDGVGTLQRCRRRTGPPSNGSGPCARRQKTCYFGNQVCPGIGPFPETRCYCNGRAGDRTWSCNAAVCPTEDSSIGTCNWAQLGQDINGEPAADFSGGSVSISSDGLTVAVGAPYAGSSGYNNQFGNVRVHRYNSSSDMWVQLGEDIDGEAANISGWSVSLSSDGTTVAVGVPSADLVRVLRYDSSSESWIQFGQDIDGDDKSGWSVSLSSDGTTVAVGTPRFFGLGYARVHRYDSLSAMWVQVGQDIDGELKSDNSGWSVSLSPDGSTVAVGASGNPGSIDGNLGGHVRVHRYDSSSGIWIQWGQDIDGDKARDRYGSSVSISSDGATVAVGAVGLRSVGGIPVYRYDNSSGMWIQLGQDMNGEAEQDYSGTSVSISSDGTTVAVGADGQFGINGEYDPGHVRVHRYDSPSETWIQVGQDINGEAEAVGRSVSISSDGTTLAVGSFGIGLRSGHVGVYRCRLIATSKERSGGNQP